MPFSYDTQTTPRDYVCTVCVAQGVRLYRRSHVVLEAIFLYCTRCASDHQRCQPTQNDTQIGIFVAAVPTEDESSYWGYSSVPERGVQWWQRLPTEEPAS